MKVCLNVFFLAPCCCLFRVPLLASIALCLKKDAYSQTIASTIRKVIRTSVGFASHLSKVNLLYPLNPLSVSVEKRFNLSLQAVG